MKLLCAAAIATFVVSSSSSHAALSGAERANFLAQWNRICYRGLRSDPTFSGVSPRTFSTICSCAGPRIASNVDYDQLFTRSGIGGRPELDPTWVHDIGMDAVLYCLNKHGGYMPGMTVTPNH